MASRVNQSKNNPSSTRTNRAFRHARTNPTTGETEFYFPMEITDPSIRALARERGLEISRTRLGYRVFDAVMVPCKNTAIIHGVEVYVDTPTDVQHRKYLDFIKDELAAQDAAKQDGRCNIPDGHGGLKRCPCRVPNPDYIPGGDKPKTVTVKCEGCLFEQFRQEHTTITLSCLDHEDEDGEMESYEVPTPRSYYAADRYEELREQFLVFVKERNPKLLPLAELLTDEMTKSEASRELGDAWGTVTSRTDKLKELLTEFLENIISL